MLGTGSPRPNFSAPIAAEWTSHDGVARPAPVARPRLGARDLGATLLAVACAAVPIAALYGFTVDDALIPARYAAHLAAGLGYRFDAAGPVTDGVTPLGFAHLLAPFAKGGPLAALHAAKALGVVAWLVAAAIVGVAVRRARAGARGLASLALVAGSAPLAAWSASGLETGLVTALAGAGVALRLLDVARAGTLLVGLAAGLRPELLPFAIVVALAGYDGDSWRARFGRVVIASLPFALVAAVRLACFGRMAPLSALAKPPDLGLGVRYALACFLLAGPLAIVAPRGLRRVDPLVRALALAIVVHLGAVALAGGDWMPLSRLVVPVLPAVVLVSAHLARFASVRATALRLGLALAGQLFVLVKIGPSAAHVTADRAALIAELSPTLAGSRKVATVDVGWAGAATDASLVDLAGVTDPSIARLPGGHTTKHVTARLLDDRGVDTILLLLADGAEVASPWTRSRFSRGVEARIARIPGIERAFARRATNASGPIHYLVLRRVAPSIEAPDASEPSFDGDGRP
jgi:hypothetical protein